MEWPGEWSDGMAKRMQRWKGEENRVNEGRGEWSNGRARRME
jgi:hypothetical protein